MNIIYSIFYIGIWVYLLKELIGFQQRSIKFATPQLSSEDIIQFIWGLQVGEIKRKVPKYKFFSEILIQLIEFKKNYGGDINSQLSEIRHNIRLDQKMSKKVHNLLLGTIFQYVFICGFVFIFCIMAQVMIQLKLGLFVYLCLLGYQLFGLLVLYISYKAVKKYHFGAIYSYIKSIYIFSNLMTMNFPFNLAVEKSNVRELPNCKDLKFLKERMSKIIKSVNLKGNISSDEFKLLISECWDYYEIQGEKFEKALNGVKLMLMAVFVLPAFLGVIYTIMTQIQL